jgi:hypothetical protein
MVAQSIAFSFTFGTNALFSCEVTHYKSLAAGLIVHFVVSTCMAYWALTALARRMSALSNETETPLTRLGHDTIQMAAKAKSVVTGLFALIPVGLVVFFGLLGQPDVGRCAKQVHASHTLPSAA